MLLKNGQGFLEQRCVRLGMHVARQRTFNQPHDAVANIAHQQILRHSRATHVAQHTISGFSKFGRGVQQRAVQINQ